MGVEDASDDCDGKEDAVDVRDAAGDRVPDAVEVDVSVAEGDLDVVDVACKIDRGDGAG